MSLFNAEDLSQANSEILQDFMDESRDAFEQIEELLMQLERRGLDDALLSELLRRLHSISSVLRIGGINALADFGQRIEALLNNVQEGALPFNELIIDVILVAMEQLQSHAEIIFAGQHLDLEDVDTKQHALERLYGCCQDELGEVATATLEILNTKAQQPTANTPAIQIARHELSSQNHGKQTADLAFFRSLMLKIEKCFPEWRGRGLRILELASAMNGEAGSPIDPLQLEAAVYMHDFGMVLIPVDPLRKSGKLEPREREAMQEHPLVGADMLQLTGGWDEAAEIVLQHHERIDGEGYPYGITGDAICDGAKLMAIADTIYAMTHKQAYRSFGRPLLRAVAEINACGGSQFSNTWVEIFNSVIKQSRGSVLFSKETS